MWVVVVLIGLAAPALAGPRKVLVLPLDGNADAQTRAKLTASVQKLARVIDGQVQPGNTTFAETAAAVGCDPESPSCAENVRTTLDVDELVYGTASVVDGTLEVVVRRKTKRSAPKEITASMERKEMTERSVEAALLPLFSGTIDQPAGTQPEVSVTQPTTRPPDTTPPDATEPTETQPDPTPPASTRPDGSAPLPEGPRQPRSREFKLGVAASIGGGVLLLAGLAMWSSASGTQDEIDAHPTNSLQDLQNLRELEDRAASRALFGNLCVAAGLAVGGYGGWMLWKDYQNRRVTVTPTPTEGGAAVTIRFIGVIP